MKQHKTNKYFCDSLLITIQKNLRTQTQGISEYELLCQLKDHGKFPKIEGKGNVLMFREHFLLMHCLYRLQDKLQINEGVWLSISPLKIILEPNALNAKFSKKNLIEESCNPELKAYYLEWNNFEITQDSDADQLLKNFWQDYAKHLNGDDALSVLGLDLDLNLNDRAIQKLITARYRELAALHHPDRGGDKEEFIKVRAAYEVLKIKT